MSNDYRERRYLSVGEAAKVLGIPVRRLHRLVEAGEIPAQRAASGQYRFDIRQLRLLVEQGKFPGSQKRHGVPSSERRTWELELQGTHQRIVLGDARSMSELPDASVHLMVTSPPYFNAKMYSPEPLVGDLGNIHDLETWLEEIGKVWAEVYRVLQPGRKAFINIMNLPIREGGTFRSLNLVGKTIDLCERLGFIFKREIVWQKTNSVRAHFGTYPYPGGILLNYAHEFILEFEKPAPKGYRKYAHVTPEQREASKLDKAFWVEIKKSDVWVLKPEKSGARRTHVAPFPYELPYRLIRAYSFVGETILDPFLGSGTTLVAARDLKRHGVGYEINPDFVQQTLERLQYQRLL
ncbi:MAG TPA: helix-turn-helix domain-containing protein [Anaerolineales bacterium]|nr:helix-turn-helix domain-containing protein [Anaerolineales bacterium]